MCQVLNKYLLKTKKRVRLRDEEAAELREKEPLRSTTGALVLVWDAGKSADWEARTSLVLGAPRDRMGVVAEFLEHESLTEN